MFLWLLLFVCYAVKCEDVGNNYYVIEMPEDDPPRDFKRPFRVYWNVPTMQCKSKKVFFSDLNEKFGIIQNKNDVFAGEEITILYEPGLFPAIFKNESSGKYKFRNGGVPQEGNLEEHLTAFKRDLEKSIPNTDFNGIGIIDFESWRPVFRQNFGALVPYKDVSYEIEKKLHWWWPKSWIQAEATNRFEEAARVFMQTTLSIAKQMRPRGLWGYYGFPHCFNMASNNMMESCPKNVLSENDKTYWLWSESTALYPSVYSSKDLSTGQLGSLVRGRVTESTRLRRLNTPVLPYFWFRYRDAGFMKEEDLTEVLQSLQKSNASGLIIWGSSKDVNTLDKCHKLRNYVDSVLGPTIVKYTNLINRQYDESTEIPESNETIDLETKTTSDIETTTKILHENKQSTTQSDFVRKGLIDPEFDWVPPENYSADISHKVEEELIKKGFNRTDESKLGLKNLNDSVFLDMIFGTLLSGKINIDKNQIKQTARSISNKTDVESTNDKDVTNSENIIKEILHEEITPVNEFITSSELSTEKIEDMSTTTISNLLEKDTEDNFFNMGNEQISDYPYTEDFTSTTEIANTKDNIFDLFEIATTTESSIDASTINTESYNIIFSETYTKLNNNEDFSDNNKSDTNEFVESSTNIPAIDISTTESESVNFLEENSTSIEIPSSQSLTIEPVLDQVEGAIISASGSNYCVSFILFHIFILIFQVIS